MIQIVKNRKQAGVKDFVCDKKDELSKIDLRKTLMGSTCFVIEEDANYILNGVGEWTAVSNYGAGGSGSGKQDSGSDSEPSDTIPSDTPIDEDNTYIWDGGEVH